MCGGRGLRSDRLRPQWLVRRRPWLTGLACAVESRVPNLASRTTIRDGLCRVEQSGAGCTANSALERQNDTNDNLRKMEGHYRIFFVTLCSMLNVRLLEPARRLEPRKPTGTSGLSLCAADQRRCRAADGIHVGHRHRHRKVETPLYTYNTQDRKSAVDFAMSSTCLHLP